MDYNAIIIGGGISGLSCAASLAAQGKKVLVLEKHSVAGGLIQTFKHKEWKWNVGTHAMGPMEDNFITRCFNYLTDNKISFFKVDDASAEINFSDKKFIVMNNRNKFIESLIEAFPEEKNSIISFIEKMEFIFNRKHLNIIPKLLPLPLAKISYPIVTFSIHKYLNKSLKEMLDLHFKSITLKNIIAFHCNKMGASPEDISFIAYSLIFVTYIEGCYYPHGSGDSIVTSLSDFICNKGGTISTNADVKQIIIDNNKATGVVLKNNTKITADIVISSIGIPETVKYFSMEKSLKREVKMTSDLKRSYSLMVLYVGFKGQLSDLNIGSRLYRWVFSSEDKALLNPANNNWEPEYITIYFSLNNKQIGDNPTAQILVPADYSFFEKWENTKTGSRGEEYDQLKNSISEKLTTILIQKFPGIEQHIAYTCLGTPLTFSNFIAPLNGSVYRLTPSVNKYNNTNLSPRSSLKNLFLTGSDIFMHGITGSFLSGIITASSICGKNLLSEFSKK
ncbi:MAG TPA: NAD(P)/FAD-dependent oxidoreductase [Chitinispirillaceae bacterium]|nr:NAD(P)/FAD-dependent oxidoreductase [Chitinispirillaceae bacterium]